jgi:flagellar protein FliS
MLYEGAISFLGQAVEKMRQKDTSGKGLFIGKALDIIAELNASLNFQEGKELAANLFHLYNFMTVHLTRANLNWDLQAVEEVKTILTQLRDAWLEVCQKAKKGDLTEETEVPIAPPRNLLGSLVV